MANSGQDERVSDEREREEKEARKASTAQPPHLLIRLPSRTRTSPATASSLASSSHAATARQRPRHTQLHASKCRQCRPLAAARPQRQPACLHSTCIAEPWLDDPLPPPSPVACLAEYEPSQWPGIQTSSGGLSKINKAGCEVKTGNPSPAGDVCAPAPWLAGQATPCALAAATMKGPARE